MTMHGALSMSDEEDDMSDEDDGGKGATMASEETKDPTSNPTEERLAKVDGLVWRRYVDDAGVFGVLHMSHREWLRPSDVSPRAACVAWYPDGASAPEVLWWTEAKALGAVGDGIRLSCGDRGRNFYRASTGTVSPAGTERREGADRG